jgi:hypothetical protein
VGAELSYRGIDFDEKVNLVSISIRGCFGQNNEQYFGQDNKQFC